jgi:hypothetical protein
LQKGFENPFLVKYYAKTNDKRNISVLMIEDVNVDLKVHEQNIDEALNLWNYKVICTTCGGYKFLTDDERDVEQEIKATDE